MLKWLRQFDWAAIFGSALVLVLALWFLAANPDYNPYPTAYKNPFEYIFGWMSPEAWTALFTCALFISTLALWGVTRTAANAAKEAAEALPVVERAYLYPVIENPGAVLECVRSAKVYYLDEGDPDGNRPSLATCEIMFVVKNYGKTPAIIKEVFAGMGLVPIGYRIGIVIQDGILGAGESTRPLISAMERGLSRNEAQEVTIYLSHIAFVGYILFEDIWGNEYRTDFNFTWEHSTQQWQLSGINTERARESKTP